MSGLVGSREYSLSFGSATKLEEGRAVTITDATGIVAYTGSGAAADGITLGPGNEDSRFTLTGGSEFTVEVITFGSLSGSEIAEAGAAIVKGAELQVGTDGKLITLAGGTTTGLFAAGDVAADNLFGAYRKA